MFFLLAERSYVGRKTLNFSVVQNARKARHDRVITRHDVAFRLQDRIADVSVIGFDLASVRKLHVPAINVFEFWSVHAGRRGVTARAPLGDEQLGALVSEIVALGLFGK